MGKKRTNDVQTVNDEMNIDVFDATNPDNTKAPSENTGVYHIVGISSKGVQINFNGYGITVPVADISKYNGRNMLRVYYSGNINNPDFKIWTK